MNVGGVFEACKSNGHAHEASADWELHASGKRVSNTLVICPKAGNKPEKSGLIPHVLARYFLASKGFSL